jgi:hypothetical protein
MNSFIKKTNKFQILICKLDQVKTLLFARIRPAATTSKKNYLLPFVELPVDEDLAHPGRVHPELGPRLPAGRFLLDFNFFFLFDF